MTRTTYRDPVVCGFIQQRYIPVWVDADRRPDVNERYNLGGWPTTAFLTPAGQLLGGETYVPPDRMAMLLRRVGDAFDGRHGAIAESSKSLESPASGPVAVDADQGDLDFVAALQQHLVDHFDAEHGGFGTNTKRVHAPAIQFALRLVAAGHTELHAVAGRTLDAIVWGGLYDDVDGGVFRYCSGRDWTAPHVEKLVGLNAAVLELLVEAWVVLGERRYRDRAADIIRYVRHTLIDRAAGGFYASQFADDDYYDAGPAERARRSAPRVARSVYADGTAHMATAFLRAAAAFDDTSLLEFAVTALERVVGETYRRGQGIAHAVDDDQAARGLLRDQVSVSGALLDAYDATDRDVYLDVAQELMRFAMRELWDASANGFVDRLVAEDYVGLLREPLKPFGSNCAAASVLARLGRLTGNDDFRARAATTLASQLPGARELGVEAAPWALAALELGR